MIKALAPGVPRGCSWVCLSIVLFFSLPWWAEAQSSKPAGAAAKKPFGFAVDDDEDAPAPAKKEAAKKKTAGFAVDDDEDAPAKGEAAKKEMSKEEDGADPAEEEKDKPSSFEVFKDPVSETLLAKKFSALSPPPGYSTALPRQVREMAAGTSNPDRDVIGKYITQMAADLTNSAYFKAVIDPAAAQPNSRAAHGIRDATAGLIDPLETARRLNNNAFLNIYNQELVRVLPKVLDNNLIARIQASIVLGQTGSPEALDLLIKQLNDKNQTVWVKLWAARGITNIVQTPTGGNRVDQINGAKAIAAAKALTDFLNKEKNAPWPARLRALEALGSLRQSASPTAQGKVEMADAALRILADPEARPEVRAEAAWALSMMRISPGAKNFNYPLIAHYASEVAADLGEKVAEDFETNPTRSEYWTTFLVYKIYPAFNGQEGVSDSGLVKMPNVAAATRTLLNQTADMVKPLARSAVELLKAPKGQQPQLAKDLGERVGTLRAFLDKNPPASTHLVPGDSGFPLKAQVAEAPGPKTRVAGAAGDR